MKIEINEDQSLDEVENELHRKCCYKSCDSSKFAKIIIAVTDVHGKRRFCGYDKKWVNFDFGDDKELTTLTELRNME